MSFLLDIDLIPTCVVIFKKVDDDFVFVDFNKKAEEVEKISKSEILNRRLTEVFPGVKDFGLFDAMLRVEKSGINELLDTAYYKDSRISGYRKNRVIKLNDGNIATFYKDTSKEQELKVFLDEKKNMFQKFMLNSEAISVKGYNDKHEVIYWNKASERIFGYTKDEALGKKLEDLIVPDSKKNLVCQGVEEWIKNGVEIPSSEVTLMDKDGNDVFVYSQHNIIQVGIDKYEMYCIDIDLGTTKALEKKLETQRDFLKTLLDTIPDLVWAKDIDGVYLSCNKRVEQFFGLKESEIVGKTDFDLFDKERAISFRRDNMNVIQKGTQFITENYIKFAGGSYKGYFETICTPLRDRENNITGILGISRDISLRKKHEKELLAFANTDILTGLANRTALIDRLEQVLNERDIQSHKGAVLFMDLDNFKDINDTKGHHVGDELLIEIAKRLKTIVRKGDTVSRFGGDEFVLLLKQISKTEDVAHIAQKALDEVAKPICIENHKLQIGVSIGISLFPSDSREYKELLHYADAAMYHAKRSGRNMYIFYKNIKSIVQKS